MSELALALAESIIQRRHGLAAAIVAGCPMPMFVADTSGAWVHVNKPYTDLLGFQEAELVGSAWKSALTEETRDQVAAAWDNLVRTSQPISHLRATHAIKTGRPVSGFLSINRATVDSFVGWFAPICDHPDGCPLHGLLLKNVAYTIRAVHHA